jgi:hypothetical protein
MLIELNGTELHANFAFLTNTELARKGRLPYGRTEFRVAAEKYLGHVWKKFTDEADQRAMEPFKSCKFYHLVFIHNRLVVPPGVKRLSNPRQIHLEEFGQEEYMQQQNDLVQLTLSFSIPPPFVEKGDVEGFYSSALMHLKETFPGLKRVRFEGGYIYHAENLVSPLNNHPKDHKIRLQSTTDLLHSEIVYAHSLLRALIKATREGTSVEVFSLNFRTAWFYEKQVSDE